MSQQQTNDGQLDGEALARAARLRYVNDDEPGIRRQRRGRGFRYVDADGRRIEDKATLERIEKLAIPPAWTDVWICATRSGHIQATGRDAKGRKQYRYHERWRDARDQTKFDRMIAFGEALPAIRARLDDDLRKPGLPREKVLAAVVQLLGTTFIRVGNEEYARTNEHYGLTTLLDDHVDVSGSTIHFEFMGKSGKEHAIDLKDLRLAKIIKRSQEVPGQHLFQYYDQNGDAHAITLSDVNDYIREISGADFTAKDFRTWGGTTLAMLELAGLEPCADERDLKKNVNAMVKAVAKQLGNTVAVCRKYYIHPAVIECYTRGDLGSFVREDDDHPEEAAVMALLKSL